MTTQATPTPVEPADMYENCLRSQALAVLTPDLAKQLKAQLKGMTTSSQRCEWILHVVGELIESPPTEEERALGQELFGMVRACLRREHQQQSHTNLVTYLAVRFIPELLAYRDAAEAND